MTMRLKCILHLASCLALLLSGPSFFAEENTAESKAEASKSQAEQCVAETDFMRRNHMDMLKHDRDETMYKGIRDNKFSLKGCIDCHQKETDDGQLATIKDEQHFCRSCHDYAAVTIDCFQCHASKPENLTDANMLKDKMPKDEMHSAIKAKQGDSNP